MRITLIEIDYHAEVLRDFCVILHECQIEIELFTTKNLWNQTGLAGYNLSGLRLHLIENRTKVRAEIKRGLEIIQSTDAIVFNTLGSYYRLFESIDFIPPVILRVHNANTYFNPNPTIKLGRSRSEVWYSVKHIFWNTIGHLDWYYRRRFLQKVNYFIFPSEPILGFAMKYRPDLKSRMIQFPIPMTFTKKDITRRLDDKKLSIVIAGIVDRKRRDYETVYQALKMLRDTRIRLVLLGKLHGSYAYNLVDRLRNLGEFLEVKSFRDFVPQAVYEAEICQAHFLLLPLRIKTTYHIYEEIYGQSKISGGESEMIKYSIPGIIPKDYNISAELKANALSYSNAEDLSLILKERAMKWHKQASVGPHSFNLQGIADRVRDLLEEVTS